METQAPPRPRAGRILNPPNYARTILRAKTQGLKSRERSMDYGTTEAVP